MFLLLTAALAAPPAGTWVTEESTEAVQARIDAAVDKAASEFGMFKSLARSRLARSTQWCKRYTVDLTGDPLTYRCDDRDPLVTPVAELGKSRTLPLEKGPVDNVVTWADPSLTVRFGDDSGSRTNVFRFEGDRLLLTVTVRSPRLSEPLTWTIPYRRQ
jgi:hypothetical protein